jgi:hypothetical protein
MRYDGWDEIGPYWLVVVKGKMYKMRPKGAS